MDHSESNSDKIQPKAAGFRASTTLVMVIIAVQILNRAGELSLYAGYGPVSLGRGLEY